MGDQDHLKTWTYIDDALKTEILAKIVGVSECSVCQDLMHVPFMMACGHSSCYHCLYSWFKIKLNCPTCRKDTEEKPVINVPMRQINRYISDVLIEQTIETDEKERMIKHRNQEEKYYQEDLESDSLFGKLFDSAVTLIDRSDGVPRCGNCHWEAHGSVCLHCGTRFRIARDDDYYDSENGSNYDEDDEEERREVDEGNDYDTADSFVDDGVPEVYSDLDDDLEIASEEWTGFTNRSDQEVISDDETSGEDQYSVDLHSALDNFHNEVLARENMSDDSDLQIMSRSISANDDYEDEDSSINERGDTHQTTGRRPRIITISDDEG